MNARRFEPWAYAAFILVALTMALFFYLGLRPGGRAAVVAYRFGLLVLGWAAAVGMLAALLYCARRRPLLQRRRAWPLTALGASLWLCSLPIAYPSSHDGRYSATRFRLPFDGLARVRYGGDKVTANPLRFDPARCHGFAFEPEGSTHLEVVAPASATLLRIVREPQGRIVLHSAEDEFFVLEGLVEITEGLLENGEVQRGARLGRVGGTLTAYLQDSPEPGRGEGVPLRFWDYRASGRLAEVGVPVPPQELVDASSEVGPDAGR